ncbi:MAG TPA: Gfo/Idh/MocA family oxidoreductase [Pseudolabrys sp.]|jgi:1,5-anhydro-D-fructose reductase (1,5-anhydro-D-mannitol-forming)
MMKWGIIGPGEIAGRSVAPALTKANGSQLHSVCGRSLAATQAFADKWGAAKAFDSLDAFLADKALDAVYIATPNNLHAEQAARAAQAGKHVLCEKPMATSVDDAQRMIEVCKSRSVALGVVFQNRYHAAHIRTHKVIASGALGEIQFVSAQLCRGFSRGRWEGWRNDPIASGAGAIVAQSVHPIDLLRFLLGREIVKVQGMSDVAPPQRPVEEIVFSTLLFEGGIHASVVAGQILPRYDNDIVIYGSKGKLVLKGTLGVPLNNRTGELTVEGTGSCDGVTEFPMSSVADKVAKLVDDFATCIDEDKEPQVSGENGLQMVKIANALRDACSSGCERSIQ